MNISKILLTGAFVGMSLASCVNENDYLVESTDNGSLALAVEKVMPKPKNGTRAVETSDFPVTIYSLTDNQEVVAYNKASEVPADLTLSVGEYYATAHTPGDMEKIMSAPYYYGRENFEILKGVNTEATITCRMANGSFTLNFSSDFSSVFKDWTITIDDGSGTALAYTSEDDGLTPAVKYMRFEENTSSLTVNFRGTTMNDSRISASNTLTKKNASEEYDGDSEYFTGGDALVLNFSPVESTDGNITGINLTANISFEESEENFEIEVGDAETEIPDEGEGGGGETPGESSITLTLPKDQTITAATDPKLGDTYIAAEAGIKSLMVRVSSNSQEMIESLIAVGVEAGVDLTNDTEVVGNQAMVNLFTQLGKELAVPAEGDKEYTFPIGDFFTLLSVMSGEHTFHLTVTDMNGETQSGKIVLTVE